MWTRTMRKILLTVLKSSTMVEFITGLDSPAAVVVVGFVLTL